MQVSAASAEAIQSPATRTPCPRIYCERRLPAQSLRLVTRDRVTVKLVASESHWPAAVYPSPSHEPRGHSPPGMTVTAVGPPRGGPGCRRVTASHESHWQSRCRSASRDNLTVAQPTVSEVQVPPASNRDGVQVRVTTRIHLASR